MRFFSRLLLALSAFCAFAGPVFPQSVVSNVWENTGIYSSVYAPYVFREVEDTPAPKGYKPFYISHYGRHGSRRQTESNARRAYDVFLRADAAGLLTVTGRDLLRDMTTLIKDHEGQYGELTPRGAMEHRTLARRMARRFRPVFRNRHRRDVFCQSSTFSRCLVSMNHFSNSLQLLEPSLRFEFATGDRYLEILAHDFYRSKEIFSSDERMYDSLMRAGNDPKPILERFFLDDPARMRKVVPDTVLLLKGLYTLGAICGCVDYLGIDLFTKYFTEEEVRAMAIPYTNRIYGNYGNSVEFGDRCSWAAKWLLEDIVRRADMALADGSACAADLRFGHDTGIMPLAALIGLGDMGTKLPRATAHLHFNTAERMTMASNIQMIFYRNRAGEVLVKFLYNEDEVPLTPLQPVSGPYYRWTEVRPYFVDLFSDKTPPLATSRNEK